MTTNTTSHTPEKNSSSLNKRLFFFKKQGVIKGWIEALSMMPVGSKWRLAIPHELAYGERGAGAAIPPFSPLVFEVELLEIL